MSLPIFKDHFWPILWSHDSMIVCQKTNATAFYPSSRSEKDRARLQKSHHSKALVKVSATPSQIFKDLNAHSSWSLQRPKEKKREGGKKEDHLQNEILRGKCIKHFFYNWILQLFSEKKNHVEKMTITWWVHHQNKAVLTKIDRLYKICQIINTVAELGSFLLYLSTLTCRKGLLSSHWETGDAAAAAYWFIKRGQTGKMLD